LADPLHNLDPDFVTTLKRIAEHPTKMEQEDGVDELAGDVLAQDQKLSGVF
jgi:hypothetical protein